MKILITGGAGYIGSVLVTKFVNHGYKVTVIDNLMYHQTSLSHLSVHRNLDFVKGDIRNSEIMKRLVKKCDIVIPLAAIVGAPACAKDENLATQVNVEANKILFDIISRNQLIIMPTTNSAYGTTQGNIECDESSPLNPISKYAKDKVLVENMLLDHSNAVSLRLATVFGVSPRMRLDLLVNNFVYRAITEKTIVLFESHFRRNFVHVNDVVQAFSLAIENQRDFVGQVFNVGLSSANLTKKELATKIAVNVPGCHVIDSQSGEDPDKRNYIVSNAKIENLGFRPEIDLDRGIAELLRFMPFFEKYNFSNL
jgi:nucleoside-diphosphate-sugar epimerase